MKKIIAFLCVFMYFMSPYRMLGHEMPEVVGLLALFLVFLRLKNVAFLRGYGVFMAYMLIIPPIISLFMGLPGNYLVSFMPVSLLFYSLMFIFLLPNLDWEYVLKFYRVLVYIAVGFFLLQEVAYYTIGVRPTFYLPFEMYYTDTDVQSLADSRAQMDRSSSFFLEPAHFAQYILPYYCIVVSRFIKERINKWEFFILSFVLLILQSGSGYWGMLAILISLLLLPGYLSKKVKIGVLIGAFVLLCGVAVFLSNNPAVMEILSRFDEISSLEVEAYGSQSGFLRIWRGYFIYGALEPICKFFGIGVGSIEYAANLIYIPGSRYDGSYMNGFQTLLVTGGLVGTFLFFRFLFKSFKKTSAESIIVIICMISLFFIEHMLFTAKMFLFIVIAIAVSNDQNVFAKMRLKPNR